MFFRIAASIVIIGFLVPFAVSQSEVPADYALRVEADEAYERGDFSRIVAIASAYLERFPGDLEAYRRRAWAHICLGDFEAAIDDANHGINPGDPDLELLYQRGVAYTHLGDYELAIRDLTAAIELDPREAEFPPYLEDWELDPFDEKPERTFPPPSPHLAKAYMARAVARALAGQLEAAERDSNLARERGETQKSDPLNFANWLRDLGHYERALLEYEGAIALHYWNNFVYEDRAYAHWYGGNVQAADADFSRLVDDLSESEKWPETYRFERDTVLTRRALFRWEIGRRKEALADIQAAIDDVEQGFKYKRYQAGVPHIHFHYAFLLHEADRRVEAARWFRDAKQAEPDILVVREEQLDSFRGPMRALLEREFAIAASYYGGESAAQLTTTPRLFGESAEEGVVPRSETSIRIHDLSVTAPVVAPGSAFSLNVSYTARGARVEDTELPVTLSLSIKEGERELLNMPPQTVMAPNGVSATTVQQLTASKRRGVYTIAISLALGEQTDTRAVNVEVR